MTMKNKFKIHKTHMDETLHGIWILKLWKRKNNERE